MLLGAALLAWIWLQGRRQSFHWSRFAAAFSGLQWHGLLLAAAFIAAAYWIRAIRWAVLMGPVKRNPSQANLVSATVIGFAAMTLLGRPGEFVRPYLISVKERVPMSSQLAAWLLERIFDLLIALLLFGFALGHVRSSGATVGPALTWVLMFGGYFIAAIAGGCLIVLLLIRQFSETIRAWLLKILGFLPPHQFVRLETLVNAFVQGVECIRSNSALALLTVYSLLEWAAIVGCYFGIARAYGAALHFGWTDILIFLGFVAFGGVVQIPGIGGGVQVVSILVLTELFHLPLELSTGVAIVLWVISFVLVVPFGIALALREGLDWRKLRTLEREAHV